MVQPNLDEVIEDEFRRVEEFLESHELTEYGMLSQDTIFLKGKNEEGSEDVLVNNFQDASLLGWDAGSIMLDSFLEGVVIHGKKKGHDKIHWSRAKEFGVDQKLDSLGRISSVQAKGSKLTIIGESYRTMGEFFENASVYLIDADNPSEIKRVLERKKVYDPKMVGDGLAIQYEDDEYLHMYSDDEKCNVFWEKAGELGIEHELRKWGMISGIHAVGGGIVIVGKRKKPFDKQAYDQRESRISALLELKKQGKITEEQESELDEIMRISTEDGMERIKKIEKLPFTVYWSKAKGQEMGWKLKGWENVKEIKDIAGGIVVLGGEDPKPYLDNFKKPVRLYWSRAKELGVERGLYGWEEIKDIQEIEGGIFFFGKKDPELDPLLDGAGMDPLNPIYQIAHEDEVFIMMQTGREKELDWTPYWSRAKELGIEEDMQKWKLSSSAGAEGFGGGIAFIGEKDGKKGVYWSRAKELGIEKTLEGIAASGMMVFNGQLVIITKEMFGEDKVLFLDKQGNIKTQCWDSVDTCCDFNGGLTVLGKKEGRGVVYLNDGTKEVEMDIANPGFEASYRERFYGDELRVDLEKKDAKEGEGSVWYNGEIICQASNIRDVMIFRGKPFYVESKDGKTYMHLDGHSAEIKKWNLQSTRVDYFPELFDHFPKGIQTSLEFAGPSFEPSLESFLRELGVVEEHIVRLTHVLEHSSKIVIPFSSRSFNDPFRVEARDSGGKVSHYFVKKYEGSHNTEEFALREIKFGLASGNHGVMRNLTVRPVSPVPFFHNGHWVAVEEDITNGIVNDITSDYVGLIAAFHSYAKQVVEQGKVPLRKINLWDFEHVYGLLAGCRQINERRLAELEGKYNSARDFLEHPDNQFDVIHHDLKPGNTGAGKILDNESLGWGHPSKDLALYTSIKCDSKSQESRKAFEYSILRAEIDSSFSLSPRETSQACQIITPYVALKELASLAERKDFGKEFYTLKAKLGL